MANNRLIKDATQQVSAPLPAAGANNNSDTIDLGAGAYKAESFEVEIAIPALGALEDNKTVTIKLQDSDDDSTYADTDPLIQTTVEGDGGDGSDAKTIRFRLPATTRRYIQFNHAVESAGGDNTGDAIVYSLLF